MEYQYDKGKYERIKTKIYNLEDAHLGVPTSSATRVKKIIGEMRRIIEKEVEEFLGGKSVSSIHSILSDMVNCLDVKNFVKYGIDSVFSDEEIRFIREIYRNIVKFRNIKYMDYDINNLLLE
jgi:hypothetical protein